MLDIGRDDSFITKRSLKAKCSHVDGVDIEPSAIQVAKKDNDAENINYHILNAIEEDFPEGEYDVVVWDGAIAHFSPDTMKIMLPKFKNVPSRNGIFVGSESLGENAADHLMLFDSLEDFWHCFENISFFWEVRPKIYDFTDTHTRQEAYWCCANQADRLKNNPEINITLSRISWASNQ